MAERHFAQRFFRDSDPACEVEDFWKREDEDTGYDGNNPDQTHIPAIGARKAGADACELTAVERTCEPRCIRRIASGRIAGRYVPHGRNSTHNRSTHRAKARGEWQSVSTIAAVA